MRVSRHFTRLKWFAALSMFAYSPFAFTDTIDRENDGQDIDIGAVREWMNTKRQVSIKEIGGNLSLSGEVRTEFQKTGESSDGISQRGSGTIYPTSTYDVAVNIMLDYRNDRTWGAIKLEFDNDAGIFSGTTNKIKVSKAYFGARAFEGDSYYADFEAGRRKLGNIFDSKLQYSSFFDGVLLKYDQSFERIGDFYVHTGVFVINEKMNQYGYVAETGLMNISGSGFYTKFSTIDWDTKDFNTATAYDTANKRRFNFIVSQFILGYKFYMPKVEKQVTIYLSGLYNFAAKKLEVSDYQKANWGSYIGFSVGELKRKGDWALDANYQFLAAQCVPDFDAGGVGLGNISNSGFYTVDINNDKPKETVLTTRSNAGGNVNFRGVSITLDYLLSNNLNLQQQWLQSVTLDSDIGPYRKFKQYEIEFIYGF